MAGGVAGTPTGRILTAMTYRRLTLILLGMAAALLVACGGDGGGSSSSHTVSPRTPESKVSTGIGDLDQPLNTALSGDEIEMARLTGYQRANCSPFPSGDSPPPLCRSEEADKTSVEVFGTVGCDGKVAWVRPEAVPDAYRSALGGDTVKLAGVYAPKPPANRFDSQYVAVMTTGSSSGVAVYIRNGRIGGLEDACGNVSRLLGPDRVASFVIQPTPGAGTAAAATP